MKADDNHFVYDGYERARATNIETIRAEVEREYAERLKSAVWLQRWNVRREMRREIERRLDRLAPPWGLYFKANP